MTWHICRLNNRQIKEKKSVFIFKKYIWQSFFSYNAILLCFFIMPLFFVPFAAVNGTFFRSQRWIGLVSSALSLWKRLSKQTNLQLQRNERSFCTSILLGTISYQLDTRSCYGLPASELLDLHWNKNQPVDLAPPELQIMWQLLWTPLTRCGQ